ncbi:MAG: GNAT family N-acetyltransferase [Candidatus Eiseniibacteriota bacterium]
MTWKADLNAHGGGHALEADGAHPLRSTSGRMRIVHASRCTLEPQVAAHAREMFNVLSDPAIYEFEGRPPSSEASLAEGFARLENRRSADGTQHWLNWVIRVPTGRLAGYVQATVLASGVSLVAYELASRYWRQGLGSSAVAAMATELKTVYGVHTLVAVLKARNYRSLALLRSLGFQAASEQEVAEYRDTPDEVVMVRREGAQIAGRPHSPRW